MLGTNSNLVSSSEFSVLVVDDNSDMISLQKAILESGGYHVMTAQSASEAFALLSEVKRPDLILLDVNMEDMSGPEFLNLLEEKRPDIIDNTPVVFLTAYHEVPKSRAAGVLRKPIDMSEFLSAVHDFIELGNHSPKHARIVH